MARINPLSGNQEGVAILGAFVADLAVRAPRLPTVGESLIGSGSSLGPGGRGSNQAVAAARLGARVRFITRLGRDAFADMARTTWTAAGVDPLVIETDTPTGAAAIFVNAASGENAIIMVPGAAGELSVADVEGFEAAIASSRVFVTQLEQPVEVALRGLEIARANRVMTVFNPAPAADLPEVIYNLSDVIVPNETEAAALTGIFVETVDHARMAGDVLLARGVGIALITLGARGALFHSRNRSVLVPSRDAGAVVDTTGAGDAFVGAFSMALARGDDPLDAAAFGCAVAGLSVTRRGTANAMPYLSDVERLLSGAIPSR